ncbi:MAG: hypothetical protein L0Y71_05530 [Gemmataceae bacterium]|nr:hypothetical protein [Gemmataceae bacterium]
MPIFGKNKNVNVTPTFTIALDKSDKSYTGYELSDDRDKCIGGLEEGKNWGIDTLVLENEPAKNSTEQEGLKVKSISLLSYPKTTKGHQDSGVYKYYVDAPTRGGGTTDRLWLENCRATITKQEYDGCDQRTKIHKIKLAVKVTAKAVISAGH